MDRMGRREPVCSGDGRAFQAQGPAGAKALRQSAAEGLLGWLEPGEVEGDEAASALGLCKPS